MKPHLVLAVVCQLVQVQVVLWSVLEVSGVLWEQLLLSAAQRQEREQQECFRLVALCVLLVVLQQVHAAEMLEPDCCWHLHLLSHLRAQYPCWQTPCCWRARVWDC